MIEIQSYSIAILLSQLEALDPEFVSGGLTPYTGIVFFALGVVSFMAVGAANPAISYALSNAAPVVAILWGIFVWKEFKGAPKGTDRLLSIIFICYIIGLVFITYSNA